MDTDPLTPPPGFQLDDTPHARLAGVLGMDGLSSFQAADPSQPAISIASPQAVRENRDLFFSENGAPRSVGELSDAVSSAVPPKFSKYTEQQLLDTLDKADSSLKGDDYLSQFVPEIQSAVKAYVDGRARPAGNSRGWPVLIKAIAGKYGDDTGSPIDDATFGARQGMRRDMGKTAPGTIGGQAYSSNTAIGHLANMSDKAVALGNYDLAIPSLTHGVNWLRGESSTDQASKLGALMDVAQHYGQEITRYYSGSQGGVEERNRFMSTINGAKSPQELASVIETEMQLMAERQADLGNKIQTTLGDRGTSEYGGTVVSDRSKANLARIRANLAKLRGGTAPSQPGSQNFNWTPDGGLVPAQ